MIKIKTFGEKIKELRKSKHLTQAKLSELTGISRKTLIMYEQDATTPRHSSILNISQALGVSPKYFNDDSENEQMRPEDLEMDRILSEATALFAGGKYSMEDKMLFYESLSRVFFECRENSRQEKSSEEN